MVKRVLQDISDFIFINDSLENADIIFIPDGFHPELGELQRCGNQYIEEYSIYGGCLNGDIK